MIKMQLNYEGNEPIKEDSTAVFAILINKDGELDNIGSFGHWDVKDKETMLKSIAEAALECAARLADPGTKENRLNKKIELQNEMLKLIVQQERDNALSTVADLYEGEDEDE